MDSLIKDFILESTENLDRLDLEFVQLEADPQNAQLLDSIFRTIHTIKGSCGFSAFQNSKPSAKPVKACSRRCAPGNYF